MGGRRRKVGSGDYVVNNTVGVRWIPVKIEEINGVNGKQALDRILRNGRLITTAEIDSVAKSGGRVHSVQ